MENHIVWQKIMILLPIWIHMCGMRPRADCLGACGVRGLGVCSPPSSSACSAYSMMNAQDSLMLPPTSKPSSALHLPRMGHKVRSGIAFYVLYDCDQFGPSTKQAWTMNTKGENAKKRIRPKTQSQHNVWRAMHGSAHAIHCTMWHRKVYMNIIHTQANSQQACPSHLYILT